MIREAKEGDEFAIIDLIKALALYENAPEEVINTPDALARDLFEDKICNALVAIDKGRIVGFALWYVSYSTWKGRCLYLEDFFVLPEYRQSGYGTALFDSVVAIAKERGYKRMDWQVLNWNELAISFYKKKEAVLDDEWLNGRFYF